MVGSWMRPAARAVLKYYAALRLAAGSTLDIVPVAAVTDVPPIVRRSSNELPSGFDRRELIDVRGRTHVVTLGAAEGRGATTFNAN